MKIIKYIKINGNTFATRSTSNEVVKFEPGDVFQVDKDVSAKDAADLLANLLASPCDKEGKHLMGIPTDNNFYTGDDDFWTMTHSGIIHLINPRPDEIKIEDIAHQLSNICRWSGCCTEFYSVAQHSIHVADAVPLEMALWGLLHDAAEAYLNDMTRPIKRHPDMGFYRQLETGMMAAICGKFGLAPEMPEVVRDADNRVLLTEAQQLTNHATNARTWYKDVGIIDDLTIIPWTPKEAEKRFLNYHHYLSNGKFADLTDIYTVED